MFSEIKSCVLTGMDAESIRVEVDICNGLPAFSVVGLPNAAVREAKDRVRSALYNAGIQFPAKRVTVNLAPADSRKEGTHLDLPIAVGIIAAMKKEVRTDLGEFAFLGELSLDGRINEVTGVLPLVLGLREAGITKIVIPSNSVKEAAIAGGAAFYPVDTLFQAVQFILGIGQIDPVFGSLIADQCRSDAEDFSDVKGQREILRSIAVAVSGFHSLLLTGPPGSGKTMMMKRIPGIMPEPTYEERLQITKVYSAAGLLPKTGGLMQRPFRAPHHSISVSAMIGGGRIPRPGEITLAHYGVLFLDEIPEFRRGTLEALRQPLENEVITVARSGGTVTYPAKFLLAAAANPCPCGYYGSASQSCTCTAQQIKRYQDKLSGPLLDRFDLFLDVEPVDHRLLHLENTSETVSGQPAETYDTAYMRGLVEIARSMQEKRYKNTGILYNSQLQPGAISRHCLMSREAADCFQRGIEAFRLSARGVHKIVKTARTIADMEASEQITLIHVAEAFQYRSRLYPQ